MHLPRVIIQSYELRLSTLNYYNAMVVVYKIEYAI